MKRDFAGAILSEQDHEKLRGFCVWSSHAFPQTYAQWQALVDEGTQLAHQFGTPYTSTRVDADEFLAWARRVGVQPCLDALRAYLIVQRFQQPDEGR